MKLNTSCSFSRDFNTLKDVKLKSELFCASVMLCCDATDASVDDELFRNT